MNVFIPVAAALILLLALYAGYKTYRTFFRRPTSYPTSTYIARMRRSHPAAARMVCLGDSITQGDLGVSFVSLLEKRTSPESLLIMNAGINGDLSCNALARLDDVIAARPALITVLIGSNDIHAGMNTQNYESYVRTGKVTHPPSFADYKANMTEILTRLQTETPARIALVSIPLMSEDTDHEVNKRGDMYNDYLRETADRLKIDYLPLRETQLAYLKTTGKKGCQPYENTAMLAASVVLWSFLGLSWDRIAERNGNQLSVDNLHSNSQTARMIADLIEEFIQQNPVQ
jgi:lysophospholipase L1-like esterase